MFAGLYGETLFNTALQEWKEVDDQGAAVVIVSPSSVFSLKEQGDTQDSISHTGFLIAVGDSGQSTDALVLLPLSFSVQDSGQGAEDLLSSILAQLADSGAATEILGRLLGLQEQGYGEDTVFRARLIQLIDDKIPARFHFGGLFGELMFGEAGEQEQVQRSREYLEMEAGLPPQQEDGTLVDDIKEITPLLTLRDDGAVEEVPFISASFSLEQQTGAEDAVYIAVPIPLADVGSLEDLLTVIRNFFEVGEVQETLEIDIAPIELVEEMNHADLVRLVPWITDLVGTVEPDGYLVLRLRQKGGLKGRIKR